MDLARDPRRRDARTRNRVVDLLRAGAIVVVVLGHWLMAAVVVRDGEPCHLLGAPPRLLLRGPTRSPGSSRSCRCSSSSAATPTPSWRAPRPPGVPYAGWLRARLRRLLTPVVPLLLAWLVASSVAYAAGVPGATLRTASQVALVPTWFLAAYVVVCAVAPATLWLWERTGWWSVVGGLALGWVDLVSLGTDTLAVGFANYARVGDRAPGRLRVARRAAGRHRAAAPARGRARRPVVPRVGRAVPRVDDRPRRGRREQLLDARVTLGFLGLLQAGSSSRSTPAGQAGPGAGPRPCSSTPPS